MEKIPWRGAWQPTPVFLPGESHGQRSLVAAVHKVAESDMTEADLAGTFLQEIGERAAVELYYALDAS